MGIKVLGLCLSLLLVGVAQADSLNCRLVGHCDTPGQAWTVAVDRSYAYVADDTAGLRVISVEDPAHPLEVGYCGTPGPAGGVAVAGSYAYVTAFGGLCVIDVSAPTAPHEAGYCQLSDSGSALGVAVAGSYAYVADGLAGLRAEDAG